MEKLLTEKELAVLLAIAVTTIRRNRCTAPHRLPPAVKFGASVRYQLSTVQKWIEDHEVGKEIPNQLKHSTEVNPPQKEKRPKTASAPPPSQKRGPGRPLKLETVKAAKNAGK